MKYSPVIIVVAFNRLKSLNRLLSSLKNAKKITNTKLIISIDNKEPDNYDIREMANIFEWPFGEKQVIYQERRLGLRKHILQCGDMTEQYGSVIILEDDLYVSPYFYDYAVQALEFYGDDEKVSGISLYSQPIEDISDKPFKPIYDDSDVFFIQFPSSWGQAWTAKQWRPFREWLEQNPDISDLPVHKEILRWPESSWKKYFIAYMVAMQKFFVFPRMSLTSNFNDRGTHKILDINLNGQAQLQISDHAYRFKKHAESYCQYDSHFELFPEIIKQFSTKLRSYEFETDLYGMKDMSKIRKPYIITSRPVIKYLWSYARALKPHDMNIILDLEGHDLFFTRNEDVIPVENKPKKELSNYKYFYSSIIIGKKAFLFEYLKKYKLFSFLFKY
jgi:hypothetical protein